MAESRAGRSWGALHLCKRALCQLSLKQKRMKFAVGQAGMWQMSDNYMDLLWQLLSCLLMCKRDSELVCVLAAKGSCASLASTQCCKGNSSPADADWIWCNYYFMEWLKQNSTTCQFSSPIRNRQGLNKFSQSIKNNRLEAHNDSSGHCFTSCKWWNIYLQRH